MVVGGVFREVLLAADTSRHRIGGSGYAAAITAARLGATASLVSYVGEDDWPEALPPLVDAGVDVHAMQVLPGRSGIFVLDDVPGVALRPQFRPAEATPSAKPSIPAGRVLLLFGIPGFDPIHEGWALDGFDELIWDRQGWMSRARDATRAATILARSRIYLANEDEASQEFTVPPVELNGILPPDGFAAAIIKRGVEGIAVHPSGGNIIAIAAQPVEARSTIGSGDVFAGALAAALAKGSSIEEAAATANRVAAAAIASADLVYGPDFSERV